MYFYQGDDPGVPASRRPDAPRKRSLWEVLTGKKKITDNGHFSGDAPYKIVYERRPVPTVNNALQYAFDSLALPGTAPVGSATAIRNSKMPGLLQGRQVWWPQQSLVSGLPIVAGQTYGQPLYNQHVPDGYVNEPSFQDTPTRNQVI